MKACFRKRNGLIKVLSCVILEDELYCVDGEIGCLYKIRLSNWRLEFLGMLEFEWNHSKVTDIFFYQGSIWCVPLYAKQIAQYHLDSKEIIYYHSDDQSEGRLCTVQRGDTFYMIPLKQSGDLIEFHTGMKCFHTNKNWREKIRQRNKVCDRFLMASYDGEVLVITQKNTKEILQIDFLGRNAMYRRLPVSDDLFGVVWMNGLFYFTAQNSRKIFVWNQKTNRISEYSDQEQDGRFYFRPTVLYDRILLTDGEKQYCFKDGKFSQFQEVEGLKLMYENSSFYYHSYLWKEKILLPPCSANMFLEIDAGSYMVRGHVLEASLKDIWSDIKGCLYLEERMWPVETYLNMIVWKEKTGGGNRKRAYGSDIYERV